MRSCILFLALFIVSLSAQEAKEPKKAEFKPDITVPATVIPEALRTYKGRTIATTMHWKGAGWLIRAIREREESAKEMLEQLQIKPGQTICDLGCGNGYHTLTMAETVGEKGAVYGVDIQVEMLEFLTKRAKKAGVDNVKTIHSLLHDPGLPENTFDLILLVDVYHEFSHPEHMLKAMRKALKPKGQIALVEYRMEDPDVPIKLLHKMSKKQILKEYLPAGFKLAREYDKLPWQHLMFFQKTKKTDAEAKPKEKE